MKFSLLSLLGVGAVGVFTICDLCSTPDAVASGVPPFATESATGAPSADTASVRLAIDGMTCGGCAIAARKMLARLDGVVKADVSYETQIATVLYDPARVKVEQMIAAVKKLGYTATIATR